jgi:hypothetical protein
VSSRASSVRFLNPSEASELFTLSLADDSCSIGLGYMYLIDLVWVIQALAPSKD